MSTYPIKTNNVVAQAEPTVGKWYCSFVLCIDGKTREEYERDDALAQYVGEGVFVDEDGEEVDMTGGDFIVEQL